VISLDTNVIVRILVEDDPEQAARARALFDRLEEEDDTAYVTDVVLCELVWVLESCYKLRRSQIVATLHKLRAAKRLKFENPDELSRTLHAFETGKGDFADYVIREHAKSAGCTAVATFDRKLTAEDLFVFPG